MAAEKNHPESSAMDYAEHEKTFGLFASLIKWGTVFSLGLTLFFGALTHTISWSFAIIVTVVMTAVVAKFF
ncbi:MAG: aa3-type cytochrome c oxidase subunit IV [Proteobacteria bacterium]|nr:aa3-type cytochrome c oxidase subunit IV [Pseudomonadota bacterium]